MVPALPGPYLIVTQARFALGSLGAFLDPVLGLEDPSEFHRGSGQRGVRQQVVVLPGAVRLPLAEHEQELGHVPCKNSRHWLPTTRTPERIVFH
jgi:hypothetical protein